MNPEQVDMPNFADVTEQTMPFQLKCKSILLAAIKESTKVWNINLEN